MYTYRRTIKSGDMIEVEYYQSIRKIGKNYGGRKSNNSLSSAKMRKANKLRAVKHMQRLINANFGSGDFFCRFSAPYGTYETEEEFRKEVGKWLYRINYRLKKQGKDRLKYIAFIECGKSGKNWHIHIIVSKEDRELLSEQWPYENGQNFTPLYKNENFKKLAEYITKDLTGKEDVDAAQKRMMTSRNLTKPESVTRKAKRKEIRALERGEMIEAPEGHYLIEDDYSMNYSDIGGAKWYFCFLPITQRRKW